MFSSMLILNILMDQSWNSYYIKEKMSSSRYLQCFQVRPYCFCVKLTRCKFMITTRQLQTSSDHEGCYESAFVESFHLNSLYPLCHPQKTPIVKEEEDTPQDIEMPV